MLFRLSSRGSFLHLKVQRSVQSRVKFKNRWYIVLGFATRFARSFDTDVLLNIAERNCVKLLNIISAQSCERQVITLKMKRTIELEN